MEYHIIDGTIMSQSHVLCNQTAGNSSNASCLNMKPSKCDKFSEINGTMPDSLFESGLVQVGTENCEIISRNNCSCSAFSLYFENETYCQLYYGDKSHLWMSWRREAHQLFTFAAVISIEILMWLI